MAPNVPAVKPPTLGLFEETAALATGGEASALAESALLCHVEHAEIHSCMTPQSF